MSDTARLREDAVRRLRAANQGAGRLAGEVRVLRTALEAALADRDDWMARALMAEGLLEVAA